MATVNTMTNSFRTQGGCVIELSSPVSGKKKTRRLIIKPRQKPVVVKSTRRSEQDIQD